MVTVFDENILRQDSARQFLDAIQRNSAFLRSVSVVYMQAPTQRVSKMPGNYEYSKIPFDLHADCSYKVKTYITKPAFVRGAYKYTESIAMETLANTASYGITYTVINGDTDSPDPFQAVTDGLIKQAKSRVIDARGEPLSKRLLQKMFRLLPSRYVRGKSPLRFLTSPSAASGCHYWDIPIQPVQLFPEDNDQTVVLLCNPKNIHVGFMLQILTTQRDIEDTMEFTAIIHFGTTYADEHGVVKAINVGI